MTTVLGAGCNKTVYRAYEGQYCSTDPNEDPQRECAKSSDLICITTYRMAYSGPPPVVRDMWLCRLGCDPATASQTCRSDEVCCPGQIVGRSYGFTHACVLPSLCAALDSIPRDGGVRTDAARDASTDVSTDAPADVAAEAGNDATSDAADAPVDGTADDAPDGN
ncbi:MAG TPA: hypothetical protein VGG33_28780 [Polyangia bacterium]